MTRTTPLRALPPQPDSNSRSLCRCTISPKPGFLTLFLSADTRHQVGRARICTFSSYLNPCVFNPRLSHLEQVLRNVQIQKQGAISCLKSKIRSLHPVVPPSPVVIPRPETSGSLPLPRCFRKPRSFVFILLQTQFLPSLLFPGDYAFPGGGGPFAFSIQDARALSSFQPPIPTLQPPSLQHAVRWKLEAHGIS